jgi:hypothetical protein
VTECLPASIRPLVPSPGATKKSISHVQHDVSMDVHVWNGKIKLLIHALPHVHIFGITLKILLSELQELSSKY